MLCVLDVCVASSSRILGICLSRFYLILSIISYRIKIHFFFLTIESLPSIYLHYNKNIYYDSVNILDGTSFINYEMNTLHELFSLSNVWFSYAFIISKQNRKVNNDVKTLS